MALLPMTPANPMRKPMLRMSCVLQTRRPSVQPMGRESESRNAGKIRANNARTTPSPPWIARSQSDRAKHIDRVTTPRASTERVARGDEERVAEGEREDGE